MVSSKLATGVLGKIWDLSDVDRDGMLDRYEFTVAMHLVFRALQGDKIPDQLPPELSPEKVPGSLSALPNLNGTAKPPAAATPQVRFLVLGYPSRLVVCKTWFTCFQISATNSSKIQRFAKNNSRTLGGGGWGTEAF